MVLAIKQKKNKIKGNIFNFGPNNKNSITVIDLIKKIKKRWNLLNWKIFIPKKQYMSQNYWNWIAIKHINYWIGNAN